MNDLEVASFVIRAVTVVVTIFGLAVPIIGGIAIGRAMEQDEKH